MMRGAPAGLAAVLVTAVALGACGARPAAPAQTARTCGEPGADRIYIPEGESILGAENGLPEEGPARLVSVGGFWIDAHEVTVAQFARFVEETQYKTVAERVPDLSAFPDAPAEMRRPGSAVFLPRADAPLETYLDWWAYVPGAWWRMPEGPDGRRAEDNEPVTQIAYEDAQAYAAWAQGRLPSEAEWERAARGDSGGDADSRMAPPKDANTWQGVFPVVNAREDGFEGVAPVACYAPNGFGLYDMLGNVWEWTADAYVEARDRSDLAVRRDDAPMRVIKGGSYLCAQNYCRRYRAAGRQPQDVTLGTNHIGFRLVYDGPPPAAE
ncbi:MAG: SUMF1/EgtB/PvdO family nonheme iron enzyme [Alphaproteobacteria bacterium]|nr:SUMF1/EgtB/PvdO family nonheme iron enzyme [Alphaproteobacteria bacterium]